MTEDGEGSRFQYAMGPFRFDSDVEFPELSGELTQDLRPVRVRLGEVPAAIEGASVVGDQAYVTATEFLLRIPGVGEFHVVGSRGDRAAEVTVAPAEGASAADVRIFLLGSVFGALCHQHGYLPLHASAVEVDGGVTAFLADSGMGKSTLAAFLSRRGYQIVSDDICLLEGSGDGMRVVPVAGWLKLWRQSFEQLGEQPDEGNRVFSADEKYRKYLGAHAMDRPRLRNVVFLARPETGEAVEMQLLSAVEAIAGMMRLTYVGYIPDVSGGNARLFRDCGRVLEGAKAFRLVAPWGWERMEAVVDLLEREVLGRAG